MDGELKFTPIQIQYIRSHWPFVRKGLKEVAAKRSVKWIPEDIYNALLGNAAELVLVTKNREYVGFFVASVNVCPITKRVEYYVVVLWKDPAVPISTKERRISAEAIGERAKVHNCVAVVLGSVRRGWIAFGFEPDHMIFRMDLS